MDTCRADSPRSETVSQCYKSPGCHAERERSICFSDTLRKADSSPAAQNDIVTQLSRGREQWFSDLLMSADSNFTEALDVR